MHDHPYYPWMFAVQTWSESSPDNRGVIHQRLASEEWVTVGCTICSWAKDHPYHRGWAQ